MTHAIQRQALLTQLTISQWTARRQDKSVGAEVEAQHQAKGAGHYNKLLVARTELEPMSKAASALREAHNRMTLPWGDNGDRLLPAKLYLEYTQTIAKLREQFDKAADAFAVRYPVLVQTERQRLGTMYRPEDYPGNIRDRFAVRVIMTPVPDAQDFRVDLADGVADELRESVTTMVEQRQADAVKECWTRVREVVKKMSDRLGDQKAVFRDTLVSNARELVEILPGLNITNDPELLRIGDEVKQLLVPPDSLRSQPSLRASTAKKADEILARMPWA